MSETTYSYRDLIVEYWDLLRGDTSQWSSRPYFLNLIQDSGQPVLDAVGVPYTINERMVRGLDYYTRTVFEVQADAGLGADRHAAHRPLQVRSHAIPVGRDLAEREVVGDPLDLPRRAHGLEEAAPSGSERERGEASGIPADNGTLRAGLIDERASVTTMDCLGS